MVGAIDGAGHLAILVTPLPAGRVDGIRIIGPPLPPDVRSVLLTIRLLGMSRQLPVVAVRSLFDLSTAEVEIVAALLSGASVSAISKARDSSPLTVRTQIWQILLITETDNLRGMSLLLGQLQVGSGDRRDCCAGRTYEPNHVRS